MRDSEQSNKLLMRILNSIQLDRFTGANPTNLGLERDILEEELPEEPMSRFEELSSEFEPFDETEDEA